MDSPESTPLSQPDTFSMLESNEQFSDAELSLAIETQLELWAQRAASRHPTVMHNNFANHIVQQLAPDSLEALATATANHPFDSTSANDLQRYEAEHTQQSYQNRKALISVTLNEALDHTPVRHPYFSELFEVARSFQDNPHTPDAYGAALQVLSRIYIHYELTEMPGSDQHVTVQLKNFAIIIDKLVAELRDHTV